MFNWFKKEVDQSKRVNYIFKREKIVENFLSKVIFDTNISTETKIHKYRKLLSRLEKIDSRNLKDITP